MLARGPEHLAIRGRFVQKQRLRRDVWKHQVTGTKETAKSKMRLQETDVNQPTAMLTGVVWT